MVAMAATAIPTLSPEPEPVPATHKIFKDFALISDCKIDLGADVTLANVVLSASGGNGQLKNANITFGQGNVIGAPDACLEDGGVQIYTNQSVHSPAAITMHGVQIVAKGDISLAAQAYGLNGINFQAGGRIDITSNADEGAWGICQHGAPDLQTADYFRLVY